ncbi:hypothetical protein J2S43_005033 [Catenuloplanes nepalensis]|uniref:Uncharacterized protein n=1 Tax=Catenuloplanes nepalensis TaxID=587533 RepID=A0ABT9MZT5_9ACTN|nr:hypothetical protein [Catenuloplanes nepalensis]MDP9796521.1 hypothetical protein [Catenuloplanes nepalensis]
MAPWRPDPSFYASPRDAATAPPETLAGMRLSLPELAGWSFLMSSAHGAGLMLLPVLATAPPAGAHEGHAVAAAGGDALTGLLAAGVHTLAMFGAAAVVAALVHEVVGLRILRTAWFNLDRLWAGVLIAAGLLTIAVA